MPPEYGRKWRVPARHDNPAVIGEGHITSVASVVTHRPVHTEARINPPLGRLLCQSGGLAGEEHEKARKCCRGGWGRCSHPSLEEARGFMVGFPGRCVEERETDVRYLRAVWPARVELSTT